MDRSAQDYVLIAENKFVDYALCYRRKQIKHKDLVRIIADHLVDRNFIPDFWAEVLKVLFYIHCLFVWAYSSSNGLYFNPLFINTQENVKKPSKALLRLGISYMRRTFQDVFSLE